MKKKKNSMRNLHIRRESGRSDASEKKQDYIYIHNISYDISDIFTPPPRGGIDPPIWETTPPNSV